MSGMNSNPNRRCLALVTTLQIILSIVNISSAKLAQPEFMYKAKKQRKMQDNSNETWITLTSGPPAAVALPPGLAPAISPLLSPIINSLTTDPPTTIDATNEPIVELTGEPTSVDIIDTSTPTIGPTTSSPTVAPTQAPTLSPTRRPTKSPTEAPTDRPTENPTKSPTVSPTISPTVPPEDPTMTPTISPTDSPTQNPTPAPTFFPTLSPVSSTPTTSPTGIATKQESPLITQTLPGLSIVLQPLTPLNATGITAFEKGTDTYYDYYYNRINSESFSDVQKQVRDVTVQTKVLSQSPPYNNGRRQLQMQMQQISYEQRVSYRLNNDDDANNNNTITSKEIVLDAMNSKAKRDVYLITLQVQSPDIFDPVDTVYMVEFQQPNQGNSDQTTAPSPVGGSGMTSSTIAIISVVTSLVVLFIILGGVWFYRRRGASNSDANDASDNKNEYSNRVGGYRSNDDDLSQNFDDGNGLEAAAIGAGVSGMQTRQNTNIRVPSNNYADEVSTLAEPVPRLGVMSSGDMSYAGYEDKSIATVDYDYSKAYGGGNTSFAGSSFAHQQQSSSYKPQLEQRNSSPQQQQNEPPQSSFSVFSDDASFDAHYQEPYKEQTIEVLAPAGKLGVVIDTPDDGAPIVHAIKETSCVADKLKVGDKLIRVDEEDVTAMTAIKVSKLISRKSANATRKLTIVRTIVNDH